MISINEYIMEHNEYLTEHNDSILENNESPYANEDVYVVKDEDGYILLVSDTEDDAKDYADNYNKEHADSQKMKATVHIEPAELYR